MRIYVGNLSFNTDEAQLEQLFAPLGALESVKLIRDHATGRSRGFAFVEMADAAGAPQRRIRRRRKQQRRRLRPPEARSALVR